MKKYLLALLLLPSLAHAEANIDFSRNVVKNITVTSTFTLSGATMCINNNFCLVFPSSAPAGRSHWIITDIIGKFNYVSFGGDGGGSGVGGGGGGGGVSLQVGANVTAVSTFSFPGATIDSSNGVSTVTFVPAINSTFTAFQITRSTGDLQFQAIHLDTGTLQLSVWIAINSTWTAFSNFSSTAQALGISTANIQAFFAGHTSTSDARGNIFVNFRSTTDAGLNSTGTAIVQYAVFNATNTNLLSSTNTWTGSQLILSSVTISSTNGGIGVMISSFSGANYAYMIMSTGDAKANYEWFPGSFTIRNSTVVIDKGALIVGSTITSQNSTNAGAGTQQYIARFGSLLNDPNGASAAGGVRYLFTDPNTISRFVHMAGVAGQFQMEMGSNGSNGFLGTLTNQALELRQSDNAAITIDTSKNSTFVGVLKAPDGTPAAPSYAFTNRISAGLFLYLNHVGFASGSTGRERARIWDTGEITLGAPVTPGASVTISTGFGIINEPILNVSSGPILFQVTGSSASILTSTICFNGICGYWASTMPAGGDYVIHMNNLNQGATFYLGGDNAGGAAGGGGGGAGVATSINGAAPTVTATTVSLSGVGVTSLLTSGSYSTYTIIAATWPYVTEIVPAAKWIGRPKQFGAGDLAGMSITTNPTGAFTDGDAKLTIDYMQFAPSTRQYASFQTAFSSSDWVSNSTISWEYDLFVSSGAGAGKQCSFCLQAAAIPNGTNLNTTVWGTSVCVNIPELISNMTVYKSTHSASLTIGGSSFGNSPILFRLSRSATDNADTLGGVVGTAGSFANITNVYIHRWWRPPSYIP